MSRCRRSITPNATYFFTVVTYRRQAFLCDEPVRNALRKAIHKVQTQYPFEINAWVLLPNHMHTIWTLPENDANFSLRWQLIKRYVTRECNAALNRPEWLNAFKTKHQEATLWQRRFWEHQIRDDADYQTHMDYCHFNPVKHGLVKRVQDWPYSSFHKQVSLGNYPIDWAGGGLEEKGLFGDDLDIVTRGSQVTHPTKTALVTTKHQQAWLAENQLAIDAYNQQVDENGTFGDSLRVF